MRRTSVTGSNGANGTTTYDGYGRPQQTKIPDGAQTNYSYTYNPNTQTATLGRAGARWKKTTLDGFGRVTRVESGHDAVTVSQTDTEYAPCANSALGNGIAQFQEFAVNARRAPGWILSGHSFERFEDTEIELAAAKPSTKAPRDTETGAMPADDGIGFDEDERVRPAGPEGAESDPEETVCAAQVGVRMFALENGELPAECDDFEAEIVMRTEEASEIREDEQEEQHEIGKMYTRL